MAPAQGWHANSWSVPYFLSSSVQSINTIGPSATGPTRIAPWRAAGPFFTSNGHMFCAYTVICFVLTKRTRLCTRLNMKIVPGRDSGRLPRRRQYANRLWSDIMTQLEQSASLEPIHNTGSAAWCCYPELMTHFNAPPPPPSPPRSRPRCFFYSFCIYLGNKYADCVSVMLLWQHKRSHYSAGFVSSRGSHTIQ